MSVDTEYAPKHAVPERRNFLGMDIVGDINPSGHSSIPQKPKEELAPILQALLDRPEVAGVKWYQYTPYFNDGDVCEFHPGECYLLLAEDVDHTDVEELDEEDYVNQDGRLWLSTYNPKFKELVGYREYNWQEKTHTDHTENTELFVAWRNFAEAISSGAFNNALLELFGDHATIQVIDGRNIEVFTYEHD